MTDITERPNDDQRLATQLRHELANALMDHIPIAVIGGIFSGVVNIFVYAGKLPLAAIWSFVVLLVLGLLSRTLTKVLHLRVPEALSPAGWEALLTGLAALNGLAWGSLGAVCAWSLPLEQVVVVTLSVIGLIAASTSTNAGSRRVIAMFMLPAMVPLGATLFLRGDVDSALIGFLAFAFLATSWSTACKTNALLVQSIRERLKSEALASELYRLSTRDELTGLANRRAFDVVVDELWDTCLQAAQPLTLILIDVDNFKAFNDGYGHPQGDACLRNVASVMRSGDHAADDVRAARYGGEEFAIVVPNADVHTARRRAEAVRASVEALGIPHEHSDVCDVVTASVGAYSVVPTSATSVASLFRAADAALYSAKRGGRNRVVASADPIVAPMKVSLAR